MGSCQICVAFGRRNAMPADMIIEEENGVARTLGLTAGGGVHRGCYNALRVEILKERKEAQSTTMAYSSSIAY